MKKLHFVTLSLSLLVQLLATNAPTPTPTESCSQTVSYPTTTVQQHFPTTTVIVIASLPPPPLSPSLISCSTPVLEQQTGRGSWMVGVAVSILLPVIAALLLLLALVVAVMWRKRR